MQPLQMVVLLATVVILAMILLGWLLRKPPEEVAYQDRVRTGWYGASQQFRRPGLDTPPVIAILRMVFGVIMLVAGLCIIIPINATADLAEIAATVTQVDHVRLPETGHMVYRVSFKYTVGSKICSDNDDFPDAANPPYAPGEPIHVKYLHIMPCLGASGKRIDFSRFLFFMFGWALLAGGILVGATGIIEIATHHATRAE